jgi:hypothetical protein
MGFDVIEFTADYENWLGSQIPLVANDLAAKHEQMVGSVLRFLRGTYYLWLRRIADLGPELLGRTRVPAVCDLHMENFGTWRDAYGVRRWGVNDFDELAWASYPLDLARLATSAALVPDLAGSTKRLCRSLLGHWRDASPGPAVPIGADSAAYLRHLLPQPKHAGAYYSALVAAPEAPETAIPAYIRAAVHATVGEGWVPRWHSRSAGTGSLGRPRYTAVGRAANHRWQAREVKLLGPPTTVWLQDHVTGDQRSLLPAPDRGLFSQVVSAVSGPDPCLRRQAWQIRALSPDAVRIDLTRPLGHDTEEVFRSMAQEMANVHAVDHAAWSAARTDSEGLGRDWLHDVVREMVADTKKCHRMWQRRYDRAA